MNNAIQVRVLFVVALFVVATSTPTRAQNAPDAAVSSRKDSAALARGHALIADMELARIELYEKTSRSVVYLSNKDALGSGFVLENSRYILTAAHVVDDTKWVDVVFFSGEKTRGKVVEIAQDADLALIKVRKDVVLPKGLSLATSPLRVGMFVASVGHGLGVVWTYNTGIVSNVFPIDDERPIFQTQIPLNPGNSGGPIVDKTGVVVGVLVAGIMEANNVNFGINVEVAKERLRRLRKLCEGCLVIHGPKNTPIFVDGVAVGMGPRLTTRVKGDIHSVMAVVDGKPKTRKINIATDDNEVWLVNDPKGKKKKKKGRRHRTIIHAQ
ncbi:MAG: trypsin-like peptidase domain-containing protein [Deltaproteobacteria bacterium]|nr:trypsin-like peptidase domain-containing protein [Deltaproteobacteria bacterium]